MSPGRSELPKPTHLTLGVAGPAPRPTLRTPGSVVATIDPDGDTIEIIPVTERS